MPEVREALATMPWPHIYPDPETRALRAALSAESGVPAANLLVGCGADELIDLLMRCVLDSVRIADCGGGGREALAGERGRAK